MEGLCDLTFLQVLELDRARKWFRAAVARDIGSKGCALMERTGEIFVPHEMRQSRDVKQGVVKVGMGLCARRLPGISVVRSHLKRLCRVPCPVDVNFEDRKSRRWTETSSAPH